MRSAYESKDENEHRITDGPFMYRSGSGELLMIWSSFIKGKYAELAVKFKDNRLGSEFEHIRPLLDNDGGHGMIFSSGDKLYLTYHSPNTSGFEHPCFVEIEDTGVGIKEEDVKKYYFHGVSHHLGLDTHDVALRELPLEAGCVITVEPGLYIAEEGIGIRIEDDALVTTDGVINLSEEIIKEVNDIENYIVSNKK